MKLKIIIFDVIGLCYNGDTLKHRGLGGSESAIILMSSELAKLGFDVTVVNNCKDKTSTDGIYNDVRYIDLSDLKDLNETFDIAISSRTVIPFIPSNQVEFAKNLLQRYGIHSHKKINAEDFHHIVSNVKHKIVWMHDTFCSGDEVLEELVVAGYINELFVLSDWHMTYILNCEHGKRRNFEVLKRNTFITRNGMTKYHDEVDISAKDPNLFVYNASVTKGMVPLFEKIWPKVKQNIPNAKLKIIGGFYKFSDDHPGDEQEMKFREMYAQNESLNLDIEFTGIIKQSEIADILSKASYMIYPATFPETFGISTLESLYYGTPLITTRFGALEETAIEDVSYMIDYAIQPNVLAPWIPEESQIDAFVDRVVQVYRNPYLHQQKQYASRKIKDICGWDSVALQWKQHFYRLFKMNMSVDEYRKVTKINSKIHEVFGRRTSNKEEHTFVASDPQQRIAIVTPVYNSEKYIANCINSIASQDYNNYMQYIIDDASTDATVTVAKATIEKLPAKLRSKFRVIENGRNVGAVKNQIDTIRTLDADDIVALVDGDDWLYHRNDIFTHINTLYDEGAEFTYGSCWSLADNIPLIAQEYPKKVRDQKEYRNHKFNWGMPYTHLRTFRSSLLMNEGDAPFTDENGQWYKAGGDNSVFYTAIENANPDAVVCVPDVLYVYNDMNPLNDYKVNGDEQNKNASKIVSKKTKSDLFTFVVPTMWRCPSIFETMLKRLTEHPLVSQVIIFDNDRDNRPSWNILNHPKVVVTRLHVEKKNYYVNPCWNAGVELSKTNRICIWNDDVEFDLNLLDKIYEPLNVNNGVFGLITGEEKFGHTPLTDGSIQFEKWNFSGDPKIGNWGDNIHGFGQLMFVRKENWTPIIDGLDIYFGDDFIFKTHLLKGLNNYKIVNIKWHSPMAVTSSDQSVVGGFFLKESPIYAEWSSNNKFSFEVNKSMSDILLTEFESAKNTPSDINQHIPLIYSLAKECDSVTEFGVREGSSTRAFLYAGTKLRSYDLYKSDYVNKLFDIAKESGVDCEYIKADTRNLSIEPTDFLFIDTLHTYDQLKTELAIHASKVKKYIAFHDTQTFGTIGEVDGERGLIPAILEFISDYPEWKIHYHTAENNGFTVLSKTEVSKNKKKILIAVPTNKYIETETFKSIHDLKVPNGYEVEFQYFYGYQIDQIRNLIAEWAKHYDYLFSVDSDIILPVDALEKLIAADKDIVTGLYIQRIPNTHTLEVYKDAPNGGTTNIDVNEIDFSYPLHQIAGCGFGCVLVKGEVFRKMEYPHFFYKSAINHENTVSEDTYFCMKAREIGYSVWMDVTIQCEHVGSSKFVVQEPQRYSVIIPTMWKCLPIFSKALKSYINNPLVGEIIIINNDVSKTPDWSELNHSKVRMFNQQTNIFVNPAWNLGVRESKFKLLCIANDDIDVDPRVFVKLQSRITPKEGMFGLNAGIEKLNQPPITDGSIQIYDWRAEDYIQCFGQFMFVHKDNWLPILDGMKISMGDDFQFHAQLIAGRKNYMICNCRFESPESERNGLPYYGGATSMDDEVVSNTWDTDMEIYKKWFLENPAPIHYRMNTLYSH